MDNVEIIGNAVSRECSCEEDNVMEQGNSATGNKGVAEEETEVKVCS